MTIGSTAFPFIDFYRDKIFPVIGAIGVAANEISWLPLVKAPHFYNNPPARSVFPIDRPELRAQLRSLRPPIVWVQTQMVYNEVEGLVKSTSRYHTVQKMPRYDPDANGGRDEVVADLRKYLRIEEQRETA